MWKFLSNKNKLHVGVISSLVNKLWCAPCASEYQQSSTLHPKVSDHAGRSSRTLAWLSSPPDSMIRQHTMLCDVPIAICNYKIIVNAKCVTLFIFKTLGVTNVKCGTLFVFKLKPRLIDTHISYPLNIINHSTSFHGIAILCMCSTTFSYYWSILQNCVADDGICLQKCLEFPIYFKFSSLCRIYINKIHIY